MAKKKITATTDNSEWKESKVRKKRKPMTEKQRIAAAERLEKARAAKPPAKNSSIHVSVLALPDDHPVSVKKVQEWIKHNRDLLKEENQAIKLNQKGAIARAASIEGYIRQMRTYLKHGDWCDNFYGKNQQHKVKWASNG